VVRHAEKEATGNDPCLTTDGKTRADHLREYLARTAIQAVFSTEACRTIETVQPLAQSRALEVRKIVQVPDQAAALRALPSGSVALVAGHSFTIPDLLRTLGVAPPVSVPGDEYDNLWVVQFGPSPDTAASMVHLRY
jgi:broad specificity phosphatase PhoE